MYLKYCLYGLLLVLAGVQTVIAQNITDSKKPVPLKWEHAVNIPELINQGKLTQSQIPNPHWKDDACLACHVKDGGPPSKKNIQSDGQVSICFNCHDARFDHSYIHPVDIKLTDLDKKNIDKSFRQSLMVTGGKITCVTCHDLKIQCLTKNRKEQSLNPKFFRSGPYKKRSEQCFQCHDSRHYQRLNPHEQIDENGVMKKNICYVCHSVSADDLYLPGIKPEDKFNLTENMERMCWGCHPWTPHPGGQFAFFSSDKGPDHLVKPSKMIMDRLNASSRANNISLPLEPVSGRVYCATCHNPHQKGVIKDSSLAKGADSKRRLREQQICHYCHFK